MDLKQFRVVPVNPTLGMENRGISVIRDTYDSELDDCPRVIYTAMLAAIPDDPNAPVLVERAELEALRRDAERYRWLRMEVHHGFWQLGEIEVLDSFGSSQCNLVSDCVDIDAACDRAIAAIAAKERGT